LILGNIGHGTGEYDVEWLQEHDCDILSPYRRSYRLVDGRRVHSLCEGALLNFLAGPANPSHVMSLTFTLCVLAHLSILSGETARREPGVYKMSDTVERMCAELHYPEFRDKLYKLSKEQREYLALDT
jgi:adenosylhomocysteinase